MNINIPMFLHDLFKTKLLKVEKSQAFINIKFNAWGFERIVSLCLDSNRILLWYLESKGEFTLNIRVSELP